MSIRVFEYEKYEFFRALQCRVTAVILKRRASSVRVNGSTPGRLKTLFDRGVEGEKLRMAHPETKTL
ncbi:hypothetical protein PHLCEN_2v12676 [Hermanssonia centrifuga]|uniref:Uncharacterized protein n=1 Tax=Hermanssonia centrifuga TaxID=98765 RepID=A0A2R6NGG1_9APHY|nr:hypothetical protein PHLCEN_2v12676 [Hermanssonia centrifuga]